MHKRCGVGADQSRGTKAGMIAITIGLECGDAAPRKSPHRMPRRHRPRRLPESHIHTGGAARGRDRGHVSRSHVSGKMVAKIVTGQPYSAQLGDD